MQRPAAAHLVGGGTGQSSLPRNKPLLLVGGATTTVRRLAGHPHLGRFTQPRSQNDITELATSGLWWAADNDALQGLAPDAYLHMLDQIAAADRSRLLFVTAPDAARMTDQGPEVSCEGTLWLFRSWIAALRKRRLPAALVAQDGLTAEQTPWDDIAALFIGGTDAWKDGPQVEALIRAARARSWAAALALSNTVGAVIDSALFLLLAFGSLDFLGGQVFWKVAMVLPSLLAGAALRRWAAGRRS